MEARTTTSGYIWVRETPAKSNQQAVGHLKSGMSMFGRGLQVSSDHGPSYREAWSEALAQLGVDVIHGAAYHPQSQGNVERQVGSVKEIMVRNHLTFSHQLEEVVHTLNFNASTAPGCGCIEVHLYVSCQLPL